MSFPRYPAYKDSGVAWIGPVPLHWSIQPIKAIARFTGGGTPSRENLDYWGGSIPWVSPKDMKSELIMGAEEAITEYGLASSTASLIPPGRLLMVVRSGILKHTIPVAINQVPVALNQDMKAIEVEPRRCVVGFLLRWIQGQNDRLLLEWAKQGATVESIEHSYLANTLLPLPPQDEQRTIADFLDRETSKIDALVAEQRRLIDLLREKRQAVITHAVTKGLNPDAPMKDSGVEWLGKVPAHWALNPLKRYIAFITSGSRGWADHYTEHGEVFLRIANLTRETIRLDLEDVQRVQVPEGAEGERTRVEAGDILFSITAYLGSVAVIPDSFEGGYVSQHLALVRVNKALLEPTWGAYVALSVCGQTWFERQSYGGTKIQLSLDDVRDLPIPVPPIEEQRSIVEFIESELGRLEEMSAQAMRAVDVLNERRAALITAAVTGQIDIRDMAAAAA